LLDVFMTTNPSHKFSVSTQEENTKSYSKQISTLMVILRMNPTQMIIQSRQTLYSARVHPAHQTFSNKHRALAPDHTDNTRFLPVQDDSSNNFQIKPDE